MRSEWISTFLGELVDVKQGLAINAKSKHLLVESGMPLLRITDLLNDKQVQFINATEAPPQTIANKEDLIYTRTGQVGHIFRGKIGVVHNNCFRIIPKDASTTRGYLYWFLSQNKIRQYANDIASGSVQKDLNHAAFKSIPIIIPSPKTQYKIEMILNSIEDKIELNRKMNETLEAMAQAIFKSWFVDFDPVHAKAKSSSDAELEKAAAELGISKAVLELFPSTFVESEMGMIPEGWEVKFLKDITKITMGQSPKGESYNFDNEGLGLLNGAADFKSGILVPQKYTTDSKREAEQGDLVFCIRATIGLLTYTDKKYSLGRGVSAIRAEDIYKELVYLRLYIQIERMKSMATGSVIIGLKKDDIEKLEVVVANDSVMNTFHMLLKPMFEKMEANTFQIRTLQQARDTLLPKLLSGELNVSNINPEQSKEV